MLIKIMPETDSEKQRMQTVEHHGVRDFLIFGNKNVDGEMIDFHDWVGSYRYLLGSLYYFTQIILAEQQNREKRPSFNAPAQPMIKTVDGGKIQGVLTAEQLNAIVDGVEVEMEIKPEIQPLQFPTVNKD